MSDWVGTIVATPYLIVPIVIWLWQTAKLPRVEWQKIGAGVLMVFAGNFLTMLADIFSPYAASGWGSALSAFFSFFATIANVLGLAIIGFYLLVDALLMWKV